MVQHGPDLIRSAWFAKAETPAVWRVQKLDHVQIQCRALAGDSTTGLRSAYELSCMFVHWVQDNRIDFAEWPAFKPSTPFGQIPVLEVDGKVIAQSGAIGEPCTTAPCCWHLELYNNENNAHHDSHLLMQLPVQQVDGTCQSRMHSKLQACSQFNLPP